MSNLITFEKMADILAEVADAIRYGDAERIDHLRWVLLADADEQTKAPTGGENGK